MGKAVHPNAFRIYHNVTLPLAFFAFMMDDLMSGHFIGGFAQSSKAKWIKPISVAAFRTSAEFIAAGFVYLTVRFQSS